MKSLTLVLFSVVAARALAPLPSFSAARDDANNATTQAAGSQPDLNEPPPIEQPAARRRGSRNDGVISPGFTGSAHDFYGPSAAMEVRCAPCHAPSALPPTAAMLDTDASKRSRLVSAEPRWKIDASTRLCLSCHDGILASEIVGGGHDAELFAAGALVNVRRDHPVGVEYPRTGRSSGAPRRDFEPITKLSAEGAIKLPGGRVECISCHDPHSAFGYPKMLVKSNRRSALCLSCHRK